MAMASPRNKPRSSPPAPLALTALNHISRNCASVEDSVRFYARVLGFVQIKRPGAFDFDGAWLFNYGIGIHLLKDDELDAENREVMEIDPKADHISFQCEDMLVVENGLKELNVNFKRQVVEEGGVLVDQLFFHDPDNHMIEVCNCQLLPVVPLSNCPPCCISRSSSLSNHSPKGSPKAGIMPGMGDFRSLQKRPPGNKLGGTVTTAVSSPLFITSDGNQQQREYSGPLETVNNESIKTSNCSYLEGENNQQNALHAGLFHKSQQDGKISMDVLAPCA